MFEKRVSNLLTEFHLFHSSATVNIGIGCFQTPSNHRPDLLVDDLKLKEKEKGYLWAANLIGRCLADSQSPILLGLADRPTLAAQ